MILFGCVLWVLANVGFGANPIFSACQILSRVAVYAVCQSGEPSRKRWLQLGTEQAAIRLKPFIDQNIVLSAGSVEMENSLKLNPTNHPKTMTCSKKFSISPGCQKSHAHSLWRAVEIWNTSRTTSDVIKHDFITTSTGITVKARVPQVPQGIAKANAATWTFVWNLGGKLEARVGVRKLAGLLWGCNIYWVQQARIPQCSNRLSPGFLHKRKTKEMFKAMQYHDDDEEEEQEEDEEE